MLTEIYNVIANILKYRPYAGEVLSNNGVKLAFETYFATQLEWLTKNGNPTTTSVVRDVLMIPGVELNIYNKQKITENYIYDEYSRVGTMSRSGCKLFFLNQADNMLYVTNTTLSLVNYNNFFNSTIGYINKDKYAFAARAGNVVCEPLSMLINIIMPKDRQMEGKAGIIKPNFTEKQILEAQANFVTWYSYMMSGFKWEWLFKAGLGSVGRAIIPDQMGEFLKWVKTFQMFNKPYYMLDGLKNKALAYVFEIKEPNSYDKTWVQIDKIHEQIKGTKAIAAENTILLCGYSYRLAVEIVQAYVIMTPTRAGYAWIEKDLTEGRNPLATSVSIAKAIGLYTLVYNLVLSPSAAIIKDSADNIYLYMEDKISFGLKAIYEEITSIEEVEEINAEGEMVCLFDKNFKPIGKIDESSSIDEVLCLVDKNFDSIDKVGEISNVSAEL